MRSTKVEDAPPLPFLPTGYPLVIFHLAGLPSLNDVLYLSRSQTTSCIRAERLLGRSYAAEWLQRQRIPVDVKQEPGKGGLAYLRAKEVVFKCKLFCYVVVLRAASVKDELKGDRRRDIYNPLIKSFIDGCTDANLWKDDSEEYHTDVWTHYAGTSPNGGVDIRFYESTT